MIFSATWISMQFSTVFFGMAAMGFALFVSRLYRGDKILLLVLGGIISGSLFNSLFLLIKYIADPYNQLPAIVYWLMADYPWRTPPRSYGFPFPLQGGLFL